METNEMGGTVSTDQTGTAATEKNDLQPEAATTPSVPDCPAPEGNTDTPEKNEPVSSEAVNAQRDAVLPSETTAEPDSLSVPDPLTDTETSTSALPGTDSKSDTSLDFSQEEAEFRADSPELDLGEETAEEESREESHHHLPDFSLMNKTEIVEYFAAFISNTPVSEVRTVAEAVKIAFYKALRQHYDTLKKEWTEAGNEPETFVSAPDPDENRLKTLFTEYRKSRDQAIRQAEEQKETNYKAKLALIEELKTLVDGNETLNHTFNLFRDIQTRWKEIGAVPQSKVKDLWETYHLHVENFYGFIKINKELRDLDLKKNTEAKTAICAEAETLASEEKILEAFRKLQKLHDDWREIGPVYKEQKEELWERFKAASTLIHKRYQDHFETLRDEQVKNLEAKEALCVKAEELLVRPLNSRKEWEEASEKLIKLQEEWKNVGYAPKKENGKIYERFRAACDLFFGKKREFYLRMKSQMEESLNVKTALCEEAESLMNSDEWKKTTEKLIALQKKWKETGAVSRKHSEAIWKRFRTACDHFFSRKSEHFSKLDGEHAENLRLKNELIEEIRAFEAGDREEAFATLKEFQLRWNGIGHVPVKKKESLYNTYKETIDAQYARLKGNDREKKIERFRDRVSSMKESGDRSLRYERERLYNKLKQLEADIQLLENNIGFFAKSKNAEKLIRDINEKIEKAKSDRKELIEKINLIDKQG